MSSTDIIINLSEDQPVKKKLRTGSGVLIVPAKTTDQVATTKENEASVKVISSLDIKGTRLQILANWRSYTPDKIVAIFRTHYENMRSLAVMLSRMKKDLKALDDPPDDKYLTAIALKKKEYNEIRKMNNDVRKKGAMAVQIIANADEIVLQALQYITSSNPNLLFCALLVLTGARPIEVIKMASFQTKLNNEQGDKSPWFACQTRFAKRGTMKAAYNQCRDRCFLVPYWLIERAVNKVRKRWPVKHLSNVEINRKYATHWGKLLIKAFPQWPGITARICRRFFAVICLPILRQIFFHGG